MGYALPFKEPANGLVPGTVHSKDTEGLAMLVHTASGLIRAGRAAGCLLEPAPRDTVLLALLDNGEAWVLSVLRQHKPEGSLVLPATTTILGGKLTLRADNMALESSKLHIESDRLHIGARLLHLAGQNLLQTFGVVRQVAGRLKERILHKEIACQTLRENVTDLMETRAGHMHLHSNHELRVRVDHADIRAKTVLDMDAEHIKLG